jgi:Tol biopolymer transport system component
MPLIILFVLALPLAAQTGEARRFAEGVISVPNTGCTSFTPDGKTVFFVRFPTRPVTIVMSHYRDGKWTTPEVAPFSGKYNDGDPAVAPDGKRIFFWSQRPSPDKPADRPIPDLWYSDFENGAWSEAKPVGAKLTLGTGGPSVAADGTLYFFRSERSADGLGRARLMRSKPVEGGYANSEPLPAPLDVPGAYDPYIAPDQSFIVFSQPATPGVRKSDLWVSYRDGEKWSEPRNLGPLVNGAESNACSGVSPDGQFLYFSRGDQGIFFIETAAVGMRR